MSKININKKSNDLIYKKRIRKQEYYIKNYFNNIIIYILNNSQYFYN
jgi:hypothetical protein